MADEKILSYEDVVLRRSYLSILSGPNFLNDRIIEFYFSYLANCHPSQDILLVPPGFSFWIANCPDPETLKVVIEPLKLPEKKLVIFAVNDNSDVDDAWGGTHWSLLAYERNANVFVHHDSNAGYNLQSARRLYNAVKGFMNLSDSAATEIHFQQDVSSPQQKNGTDCGLYVTAIAKFICDWYSNCGGSGDLWLNALNDKIMEVQLTVSKMRNEILTLIQDMMAKRYVA